MFYIMVLWALLDHSWGMNNAGCGSRIYISAYK